MVESADTTDLKSVEQKAREGSNPSSSTKINIDKGDDIIGKVKDIIGQRFGRLIAIELFT